MKNQMTRQQKRDLIFENMNEAKHLFITNFEISFQFETIAHVGKAMIHNLDDRFTNTIETEHAERQALLAMVELKLI